jgi:transcriptional regulator with XRE-family HTH domain
MRKSEPLPAFSDYLRGAIPNMGFQTPTDFARAAQIHPSVVLRWLNGEIRPTVPLLERAAPVLGARLSTLIRIAYPEVDDGLTADEVSALHPLAAELQRHLGPRSNLPAEEQHILISIIDRVLAPYRSRSSSKGRT